MIKILDIINFYSVNDNFGEFSNFALFEVIIDGKKWATTEHYFQAQKFLDKSYQEKIRKAKNPMQAAVLGRDKKQKLRKDWESVKVSVMKNALYAKFSQHAELKELLLSTNDAKIVEHTENDDFWGDGGDGKGKNMLGKMLMQVREELKNEKQKIS